MFRNIYKDFPFTKVNSIDFLINGDNIRIRTHDTFFFGRYQEMVDEIPKRFITQGYI